MVENTKKMKKSNLLQKLIVFAATCSILLKNLVTTFDTSKVQVLSYPNLYRNPFVKLFQGLPKNEAL